MTFEEHLAAWRDLCVSAGHGAAICPECDAKRAEVWQRNEQARAARAEFAKLPVAEQERLQAAENKAILDKYFPLPA